LIGKLWQVCVVVAADEELLGELLIEKGAFTWSEAPIKPG